MNALKPQHTADGQLEAHPDRDLLAAFVANQSHEAFAELTRRHVDMVFCTSMRCLFNNVHDAEDATQAVFILLAQRASSIRSGAAVAVWLYRTTLTVTSNMKREYARERHRKTITAEMTMADGNHHQTTVESDIAPLLDAAIQSLRPRLRDAVVMVCIREMSYVEAGRSLGISENAALKRVQRGKEKLRQILRRRGISVSTTAVVLALQTSNAPCHAAAALVNRCTCVVTGTTTPSAAAVATSALKTIKLHTIKTVIAAAAAVSATLLGIAVIARTGSPITTSQTLPAPPKHTEASVGAQRPPNEATRGTLDNTPATTRQTIYTESGGRIVFASTNSAKGGSFSHYGRLGYGCGWNNDEYADFVKSATMLSDIKFPFIEFHNTLLPEALRFVEQQSKHLDPTGLGVTLKLHRSITRDSVTKLSSGGDSTSLTWLLKQLVSASGATYEMAGPRTIIIRKPRFGQLADAIDPDNGA